MSVVFLQTTLPVRGFVNGERRLTSIHVSRLGTISSTLVEKSPDERIDRVRLVLQGCKRSTHGSLNTSTVFLYYQGRRILLTYPGNLYV